MRNEQLFPWEPPDDLGDETIAQLIELLDEITRSLENHYAVRPFEVNREITGEIKRDTTPLAD